MSHVIKAVLHNPSHPEYGQITIPFPIPLDEYDQTTAALSRRTDMCSERRTFPNRRETR